MTRIEAAEGLDALRDYLRARDVDADRAIAEAVRVGPALYARALLDPSTWDRFNAAVGSVRALDPEYPRTARSDLILGALAHLYLDPQAFVRLVMRCAQAADPVS